MTLFGGIVPTIYDIRLSLRKQKANAKEKRLSYYVVLAAGHVAIAIIVGYTV